MPIINFHETLIFNFLPELFFHMAGFSLVKHVQLTLYSTPV
jgi:hypothetical protein